MRMRIPEKTFDRIVKRAVSAIPEEIRKHLNNVVISVLPRPTPEMRREMRLRPNDEVLGLFRARVDRALRYRAPGVPRHDIPVPGALEEMAETVEALEEQIGITVVHEVAHYIGMSEERLPSWGMADFRKVCPE